MKRRYALVKVFKVMDGLEGNLHAIGGSQGSEGRIALIVQENHLFDAQVAYSFDHSGKPVFKNLRVCKMDIDDIAEKLLPEKIRWHYIFEELPLGDIFQLRHEAEGKGDLADLAQLIFSLGFPDVDPLPRNCTGGCKNAFVFPPFVDEVKGMIPPLAVFLTGVAGDAILKYRGIFPPKDLDHLFFGLILFKLQILAFHQTGAVRTVQAALFIELQFKHSNLLQTYFIRNNISCCNAA
jgi:hypothetical protein